LSGFIKIIIRCPYDGILNMHQTRFEKLCERSEVVYGHRHVLPVAVWILESDDLGSFGQPEIRIGLEGHSPPNKISRALVKLEQMGALSELPYVGRPYPRAYEKRNSAQWDAFKEYAGEVDSLIEQAEKHSE
jgi:hypothetical protein